LRGLAPTPAEATAMLLGIYEDTGSLTYAATAPEDLEAAAWLLRMGGELAAVAEFAHRPLTGDQRELLAALLDGLEVVTVGGAAVAVAVAPPRTYVEDAAVLVHRLLDAEGVDAAFALAPMAGELYAIGRSRSDGIDVAAALRPLGGGGHPRAASATLRGPEAEDVAAVRARLLAALPAAVRAEPTARDLMTHPVRSIHPGAAVAEARELLARYGHSGLVVLEPPPPGSSEPGRLVGVITRRDVDKARHHGLEHAPVRAFMAHDPRTAAPETPLAALEAAMLQDNIGRLPVVEDGAVVGIVTRTDLLRARYGSRYATSSSARSSGDGPDSVAAELRERLPAALQRVLRTIGETAARRGDRAYLVGGFVRDLLVGARNLDVDVLVEPDGPALAAAVAAALAPPGGTPPPLKHEPRFETAKLQLPGFSIDFATARTESYDHPGALPAVEPSSVLEDLRRRDFTLNAMAVSLAPEQYGRLLDPYGGRKDIEQRRIRLLPNTLSFLEDPTRLFRGVRFEERFRFRMDERTETLARDAVTAGALGSISPERLRAELERCFAEPRPLGVFLRLQEVGALRWLHPELEPDAGLLGAVPSALEWWERNVEEPVDARLVFWAALLAPLPPAEAVQTAEARLRMPPPRLARLREALDALHDPERLPREGELPGEIHRRLRPLRAEALAALRVGAVPPRASARRRTLLDRYLREWRAVRTEISGDDLRALGYRPGPAMGAALEATLTARLNDEVRGREAELAYACRYLDTLSLEGTRRDVPDVHDGA
jgi:tRNA nucleotidyltransferase (CCA-adding enzyme)